MANWYNNHVTLTAKTSADMLNYLKEAAAQAQIPVPVSLYDYVEKLEYAKKMAATKEPDKEYWPDCIPGGLYEAKFLSETQMEYHFETPGFEPFYNWLKLLLWQYPNLDLSGHYYDRTNHEEKDFFTAYIEGENRVLMTK